MQHVVRHIGKAHEELGTAHEELGKSNFLTSVWGSTSLTCYAGKHAAFNHFEANCHDLISSNSQYVRMHHTAHGQFFMRYATQSSLTHHCFSQLNTGMPTFGIEQAQSFRRIMITMESSVNCLVSSAFLTAYCISKRRGQHPISPRNMAIVMTWYISTTKRMLRNTSTRNGRPSQVVEHRNGMQV